MGRTYVGRKFEPFFLWTYVNVYVPLYFSLLARGKLIIVIKRLCSKRVPVAQSFVLLTLQILTYVRMYYILNDNIYILYYYKFYDKHSRKKDWENIHSSGSTFIYSLYVDDLYRHTKRLKKILLWIIIYYIYQKNSWICIIQYSVWKLQ